MTQPPLQVPSFETAIAAADTAILSSQKRMRETLIDAKRKLRKPVGDEEYPFHEPEDVLFASFQAVTAVTGDESPHFDLRSDPRRVFAWARDAIIKYGDDCREEGIALQRANSEPRVRPEAALQMMTLMGKMQDILADPSNER